MKRTLVVVLSLAGIAGCSSDTASPAVCDSYAAVQNTVDHIRDTNVSENGVRAMQPYVSQLRQQLDQLSADAQAQFASQATALRTAFDHLGVSLRTAAADPDRANLSAVRTSVTEIRTSAQNMRDAMKSTC